MPQLSRSAKIVTNTLNNKSSVRLKAVFSILFLGNCCFTRSELLTKNSYKHTVVHLFMNLNVINTHRFQLTGVVVISLRSNVQICFALVYIHVT